MKKKKFKYLKAYTRLTLAIVGTTMKWVQTLGRMSFMTAAAKLNRQLILIQPN